LAKVKPFIDGLIYTLGVKVGFAYLEKLPAKARGNIN